MSGQTVSTVDQGTVEAIQQSVARIGTVEQGELGDVAPWLGLPSLEGRSAPPDVEQIRALIEDQEPAAAVVVSRTPDPSLGEGWETLTVSVGLA
jgi:hypothetical protein